MSRAVTLLVLAFASELTRLRLPCLAARFSFTSIRFIVRLYRVQYQKIATGWVVCVFYNELVGLFLFPLQRKERRRITD